MDSQEPTPDELAELFALDKDISALCGRLLSELKGSRPRGQAVTGIC
jgi:hypothetical protein